MPKKKLSSQIPFTFLYKPENPKLGSGDSKDEISKAKENLLKWILEKKNDPRKSIMSKPMSEVHDHSPPTTQFHLTQNIPQNIKLIDDVKYFRQTSHTPDT